MKITTDVIEQLLYEEEGTTLDFKREQYRFENATKEDKSELLKDVLAFANSFRRTDAFILIGVEEVRGGRSKVFGVSSHLDDAKLQQFINSKTQRPVVFSYREVLLDNLPIGLIHIPLQRRPLFTKSNFGIVKKDTVYLRRGSSTGIADPDEVAQMGSERLAAQEGEPTFELKLFGSVSDSETGETLQLTCTRFELPEDEEIPDYAKSGGYFEPSLLLVNRDYYRDLVKFTQITNFFKPISFALKNTSGVSAHDVRLVFEVEDVDKKFKFLELCDMPDPPLVQRQLLCPPENVLSGLNSTVDVSQTGSKWRIEYSFGKIQPHDTVEIAGELYIGTRFVGDLSVNALIYADNVSRPLPIKFLVRFKYDRKVVSLDEIEEMEHVRFCGTPEGKKLLKEIDGD